MRSASVFAFLVFVTVAVYAVASHDEVSTTPAPLPAAGQTILQSESAVPLAAASEARPDASRTQEVPSAPAASAVPQAAAPSVIEAEIVRETIDLSMDAASPQSGAASVLASEATVDTVAPLPASTPATLADLAMTANTPPNEVAETDIVLSAESAVPAQLITETQEHKAEREAEAAAEPQPASEPARLVPTERPADKPPVR